ncbi:MAG: DUF3865 domain-containing protein [Gammaproteobacteria bacterium]|nr:DUF3865 domain-containing protein [Gammaproteobacteria bacterium]
MNTEITLSNQIDNTNYQFTSNVKNQLRNLSLFSEEALEWLMMEHYQFSFRNTSFLLTAVNTTKQFNEKGVSDELLRNFNEEKNHAAIYKKALFEIGTDVDKRTEFTPTTAFFETISHLISNCPSYTLGAMYATETAAIFEHEVFHDISNEVIKRRKHLWEKSKLKAFHDMHLNGVEQGHKDGLGMFVDIAKENYYMSHEALSGLFIKKREISLGANQAINSMTIWWDALLKHAETLK